MLGSSNWRTSALPGLIRVDHAGKVSEIATGCRWRMPCSE